MPNEQSQKVFDRSRLSVSVVIRCYNEERHLGRLLQGIGAQTLSDPEVIVVDSGSTDASPAIAREYGARLLTIPKHAFSFGRSLNLGCEAARGELLVAVSAHCYPLYADWLERLLEPFQDERVAMSYGMQRGNHRTRFSEQRIFRQWYGVHSVRMQTNPFANNANSAFRRCVWEVQRFDETLTGLEDLDWAQRILRLGWRIAYVAEAPVVHVHEETWTQVYNRYRREAMAMRRIFPHTHFGLIDFWRLLIANIVCDWRDAAQKGCWWQEAAAIVQFRWCQYFGAVRGYRQRDASDEHLRQTFYFPAAPEKTVSAVVCAEPIWDDPARQRSIDGALHAAMWVERPGSMTWIDISVPLDRPLPVWPGDPLPQVRLLQSLAAGDAATVSALNLCVHTGTHIDAPAHFLPDGSSMGGIALERLIGPAYVACFAGDCIDAQDLAAAKIPPVCTRLLLRTRNSLRWEDGTAFVTDYVALTPEAASWLVAREIGLVGIDYLSIERYGEVDHRTHRILLAAGVVIVEGLNLRDVETGDYELLCLPLRLDQAEGSPARAVLRRVAL